MINELKEIDKIHNGILSKIENTEREDLFWKAHLKYKSFLEDLQIEVKQTYDKYFHQKPLPFVDADMTEKKWVLVEIKE